MFERLKKEIIEKSEQIVMDLEPVFLNDKKPRVIKIDEFSTLDELWSACTMEDASRAGESHSEAKTIDVLEFSDEGGMRSKAVSLLNLMFERWQSARQELSTSIEKANSKKGSAADESTLGEDLKVLFWGKEVKTDDFRENPFFKR